MLAAADRKRICQARKRGWDEVEPLEVRWERGCIGSGLKCWVEWARGLELLGLNVAMRAAKLFRIGNLILSEINIGFYAVKMVSYFDEMKILFV